MLLRRTAFDVATGIVSRIAVLVTTPVPPVERRPKPVGLPAQAFCVFAHSLVVVHAWSVSDAGVVVLPSGRLICGRGLRTPMPDGIVPDFGIYLLNE